MSLRICAAKLRSHEQGCALYPSALCPATSGLRLDANLDLMQPATTRKQGELVRELLAALGAPMPSQIPASPADSQVTTQLTPCHEAEEMHNALGEISRDLIVGVSPGCEFPLRTMGEYLHS